MTDPSEPTDDRWRHRLATLLADVVDRLDADDRAERIAQCQATGEHGVRVHVEGEMLRLTWGGRDLALVERAVLTDHEPLPEPEWLATPDSIPEDWGSGGLC